MSVTSSEPVVEELVVHVARPRVGRARRRRLRVLPRARDGLRAPSRGRRTALARLARHRRASPRARRRPPAARRGSGSAGSSASCRRSGASACASSRAPCRARVMATYARRRSSSSSSRSPGSTPLYGNISSSIPVRSTCSNSSPFAPCTVISVTRPPVLHRVDVADQRHPLEEPRERSAPRPPPRPRPRSPASSPRAPGGSRRARRPRPCPPSSGPRGSPVVSSTATRSSLGVSTATRSLQRVEQLPEGGELLLRRRCPGRRSRRRARARRRATARSSWPTPSSRSTVVCPMPRAGTLTMRARSTSLAGFTSTRRYASASFTSARS